VQKLAPGPAADDSAAGPAYDHHASGEDNGDAHLKNLLIGHQVIVPITAGKLDLGPWQQIFYYEFDGRRPKRLVLKAIGE
jgi:secondary thiamine-phosphate synthase enzyme